MVLAVNPATCVTSERPFSLARRIKTCIRSTMMPKQFNSLSISNCPKTETSNLNVLVVTNEFMSHRTKTFGLFVDEDTNVEQL